MVAPLRILDVGAGLAQLSIRLAANGHLVTVNDISQNMLNKAKILAEKNEVIDDICWIACPYQQLDKHLKLHNHIKHNEHHKHKHINSKGDVTAGFDLVLCHALLEWLDNPVLIMPYFKQWLTPTGYLSLCFYNPTSFVYRNLIVGNFNVINSTNFKADNKKSLTPNNPVEFKKVEAWLKELEFQTESVSGLRVFHDYALLKRGGHTNPDAVIDMELKYSIKEPYKWLGRYLHVLACNK